MKIKDYPNDLAYDEMIASGSKARPHAEPFLSFLKKHPRRG